MTFNAFELALMVEDIASPDSKDSLGAKFLLGVQSVVGEDIDDDPDDLADTVSEIADHCVPVYTHELWQVFVDLAAYNVDTSDLGRPEDMTQGAQWALYLVAEQLATALLTEDGELEQA